MKFNFSYYFKLQITLIRNTEASICIILIFVFVILQFSGEREFGCVWCAYAMTLSSGYGYFSGISVEHYCCYDVRWLMVNIFCFFFNSIFSLKQNKSLIVSVIRAIYWNRSFDSHLASFEHGKVGNKTFITIRTTFFMQQQNEASGMFCSLLAVLPPVAT